jgi:hypothetical protein
VSSSPKPEQLAYVLVVGGDVTPAFVEALDGFEIADVDGELTSLVGWANGQGHLHDLLTVIRDFNVGFVAFRPATTWPDNGQDSAVSFEGFLQRP